MITKVFLSSTYLDLLEFRKCTAEALQRLGHVAVRMEVFGARPEEPTAACLAEVKHSDLFVGIYGRRYGFIPPGSTLSVTEQEFHEARKLRKPLFCFVLDRRVWEAIEIRDPEHEPQLETFLAQIDAYVVRDTFRTPEDLAMRVATSISRYLLQQVSSTAPSVEQLVTLLRLRKDAIVRLLEDAKREAIAVSQRGHISGSRLRDHAALLDRFGSIKAVFLRLYRRHVGALKDGDLALAHELTIQIHNLLWIQARDAFSSIHSDRELLYQVRLSTQTEIKDLYPENPIGLSTPAEARPFPDPDIVFWLETLLTGRR